jgi:hypothetical protein
MKRLTIVIAWMLFVGSVLEMHAQNNAAKDCSQHLQASLKQEELYLDQLLAQNKCWQLKYTMQSNVYANGKYTLVTTNGELKAKSNFRYIKTDAVEVYMDEKDAFTIDKRSNAIMHTASSKELLRNSRKQYFDIFSDSNRNAYIVSGCKPIIENGKKMTRYDVTPRYRNKLLFALVSYFFEEKTNILRKMYVEYNTEISPEIKNYTFYVHERDEVRLDKDLYPVKNHILTSNGHLKPVYSHYKYQDLYNNHKK